MNEQCLQSEGLAGFIKVEKEIELFNKLNNPKKAAKIEVHIIRYIKYNYERMVNEAFDARNQDVKVIIPFMIAAYEHEFHKEYLNKLICLIVSRSQESDCFSCKQEISNNLTSILRIVKYSEKEDVLETMFELGVVPSNMVLSFISEFAHSDEKRVKFINKYTTKNERTLIRNYKKLKYLKGIEE